MLHIVIAFPPACCFIFFFFSSRRRHTRYIGDWSSDVCSSDLVLHVCTECGVVSDREAWAVTWIKEDDEIEIRGDTRSEERRVGKECRYQFAASVFETKTEIVLMQQRGSIAIVNQSGRGTVAVL